MSPASTTLLYRWHRHVVLAKVEKMFFLICPESAHSHLRRGGFRRPGVKPQSASYIFTLQAGQPPLFILTPCGSGMVLSRLIG